MIDKRAFDFWLLWLLGMTVLLLPLTPSVVGLTYFHDWVGYEQVVILFLLALGWNIIVVVHPRLRLDTSVVLGSVGVAFGLYAHWFLFSPWPATPLLWEWIFFLLLVPAAGTVIGKYKVEAAFLVVVVLTLQAQWAVLQFAWQRDLGFSLVGESYIRADVVGVAKFLAVDHKIVRAYGPYSHPNSLGAGMVMGLTIMVSLRDFLNNAVGRKRVSQWIWLVGGWMLIALLLSFSRSAYVGAGILGAILLIDGYKRKGWRWEPRSTFVITLLIIMTPLFVWRISDREAVALEERVMGVSYALNLLREQPWIGSGVGTYPEQLLTWTTSTGLVLRDWQVTYVHMVPLLMVVELGLLLGGGIGVMVSYWSWRHRFAVTLLLPLLPAFFLDHFLYTYPVMWLLAACLLFAASNTKKVMV